MGGGGSHAMIKCDADLHNPFRTCIRTLTKHLCMDPRTNHKVSNQCVCVTPHQPHTHLCCLLNTIKWIPLFLPIPARLSFVIIDQEAA